MDGVGYVSHPLIFFLLGRLDRPIVRPGREGEETRLGMVNNDRRL